jgi:5-methyltetrahydropteroyltriglutamate--homocysteine methyltransferase
VDWAKRRKLPISPMWDPCGGDGRRTEGARRNATPPTDSIEETIMPATPPFRADIVGSFLRPDSVKRARKAHFEDGTMSAAELKAVEDKAIADVVKMQEGVGLKAVTDGEYRRSFWHYDFMGALDGFELVERAPSQGVQFHGVTLRPIFPTITGRLDFPADHPMLEHYRYLASVTGVTPKISIPGPSCCHFRTAKADIRPPEYADLTVLFSDLARTYAKAVQAFYDAGCRYLQMDDIFFAYLCDPKIRAQKQAEGLDPDWLIQQYAKMMHDAIEHRPDDMVIGMHMCRGNFKSTWVAEGAYDPAADAVFNQTGVDIYFMEYDSERAGGFEPLARLPKGRKRVMAGLITTKTAGLESLDDLKRKFESASRYADIDQLGIAPQCGFASTEEGNAITEDDQKRKLELVVNTAEAIWGAV